MKRSTIALCLAVALPSCSDSLLDHVPEDSVTVGNFYQTQADFERAVTGVYQGMQAWTVDIHFYLSEVRSKNFWAVFADAQRDWFDISTFNAPPNLAAFSGPWANHYAMINRANEILERIDDVEFTDDALRERYKAEVRFLRALAYFQLVQLYDRVPLVDRVLLEREALELRQSEPDEIFDFIVSEMSAVADELPREYDANDVGRVTEQAAKGILARVYMTMAGYPLFESGRFEDARVLLEEIIAMEGSHVTFAESFADLFTYGNENQHHIFEIQYVSGVGAGNSLPGQVHPDGLQFQFPAFISASRLTVSEDLIAEFEEGDARFAATIDSIGNTWYFSKFTDLSVTIPERGDFPVNFPLLRYADVLLMHAEVENELNGGPTSDAVAKLNRIRSRAGLPDVAPPSQEEFRMALETERRKEFAFEGRYWFDLRRTDRGMTVMNEWFQETQQDIAMTQDHYSYPIPLSQMDVFPGLYEQNPGY